MSGVLVNDGSCRLLTTIVDVILYQLVLSLQFTHPQIQKQILSSTDSRKECTKMYKLLLSIVQCAKLPIMKPRSLLVCCNPFQIPSAILKDLSHDLMMVFLLLMVILLS